VDRHGCQLLNNLHRCTSQRRLDFTWDGLLLGGEDQSLIHIKFSIIELLRAAQDMEDICIDVYGAHCLVFGSTIFSHLAACNPRLKKLLLRGNLRNNVNGTAGYSPWDGDDEEMVDTRGSLTGLFVNCKQLEKIFFNEEELFLDPREADAEEMLRFYRNWFH